MTDPAPTVPTSRADQRRRTEQRILDAATRSFFDVGYERTTIRAVAAAAEVDPGLVMHYFDSKQALFRRVIDTAPLPQIDAEPGHAADHILANLAERLAEEPVASLTVLRSMLTTPEAADAIGSAGRRYQANLAQAIRADDAALRAAVINAVLLGITVSRHLLKYDELADADPARIIELLRPGLSALADGDGGGDNTQSAK